MEIGIGTFEGCFRNMAGKVFPIMSQNGESSFVEIGIGTFEGCFIDMVRNAEIHCSIIRNSKLENIIFIEKK